MKDMLQLVEIRFGELAWRRRRRDWRVHTSTLSEREPAGLFARLKLDLVVILCNSSIGLNFSHLPLDLLLQGRGADQTESPAPPGGPTN
jgi:hypothetical protein